MPIDNRAKGRDIDQTNDASRVWIRDNTLEDAQALTERTLPIDWDKFHEFIWFILREILRAIVSPRLSKMEPFYVVPKNSRFMHIE